MLCVSAALIWLEIGTQGFRFEFSKLGLQRPDGGHDGAATVDDEVVELDDTGELELVLEDVGPLNTMMDESSIANAGCEGDVAIPDTSIVIL